VTKGAESNAPALGMAFKLLKTAEERWRRFNGHELVADVLAGAPFKDGIRVPDQHRTQERGGRRLTVFTPTSATTLDNCSIERAGLGIRTLLAELNASGPGLLPIALHAGAPAPNRRYGYPASRFLRRP
jgi:hypothetical protein